LLVYEGEERLAGPQASEVLDERLDHAPGPARRAARRVGRHDHARMGPEPVTLGQGLGIGDVEAGAPQEPLVEGGEEIVAEDDLAARDVDENARGPHAPEEIGRGGVPRGLGRRGGAWCGGGWESDVCSSDLRSRADGSRAGDPWAGARDR